MSLDIEELNKIMERIAKMIALANDAGATEGEKANAKRMASELMSKYNIREAQLGKRDIKEKSCYSSEASDYKNGRLKSWVSSFYHTIYTAFGVYIVFGKFDKEDKEPLEQFILAGRDVDIQIADYTIEVIYDQVIHKVEDYRKQLKQEGVRWTERIEYSYYHGLLSEVKNTITSLLKDVTAYKQPSETTGALTQQAKSNLPTLMDEYQAKYAEAQEYMQQKYSIVNSTRRITQDANAKARGMADAASISVRAGAGFSPRASGLLA